MGMEDVVREMDEEGAAGLDFFDQGEGLLEGEVFGMGTRAEGSEDEGVEVLQLGEGGRGHFAEIGAIGQGTDAKAEGGAVAVTEG